MNTREAIEQRLEQIANNRQEYDDFPITDDVLAVWIHDYGFVCCWIFDFKNEIVYVTDNEFDEYGVSRITLREWLDSH